MDDREKERARRLAGEAEGYLELDLYEEALERAERLLAFETMGAFARSIRAECLRSLGRWEEAAVAFEELVGLDPTNVGAWVGIGWCRKREGRLDLAMSAMESLIEHRPEEAIGIYNLACYCALEGDRERALDLLDQAFGLDADYRRHAQTETDLDSLRDLPEFGRLVKARQEKEKEKEA